MSCPPDKNQIQAIAAAKQKLESITKKISSFSIGSIIKGMGAKLIPANLKNLGKIAAVPERQDHASVITDVASKLTPIETEMAPGGTEIISYTNDLHITVGGKFVSSQACPPIRKTSGLPVIEKIQINNDRTDVKLHDAPYVETLSHPVPWGNYSILANNSFNLVVGANGIVMSTEGNLDINAFGVSTISSLNGLNLTTSEGNLNIICGNHVHIVGKTVNIQTCNENDQVVVNSNLGIKKNAVVHGSLYVDGEIYAQHLTIPAQTQETTQSMVNAFLPPEQVIAYADFAPWCTWFDTVFMPALIADLMAAYAGPFGPPPMAVPFAGFTNITFRPFMPGLKFACRSFEYLGAGIPNGMYCYNPGAPVGSTTDIALYDIHWGNNGEKSVYVHPHAHNYYGPASSKPPGNGSVRDDAASVINSGITGEAKPIVHGGSGLEP
jgi:hypothetical protein